MDWQSETTDPDEFMQRLKVDLEQDEVFVFTPKGKVVTLPVGATPIDFAYAIHTEVGHACIGARVNGRLVPLDLEACFGRHRRDLHVQGRGCRARPATGCRSSPHPGRRRKIRQWFSRERREDAIEQGRDELIKALRREGLPVQKLQSGAVLGDTAKTMNYADLDALYVVHRREPRVGQGRGGPDHQGAARGRAGARGDAPDHHPPAAPEQGRQRAGGVHVEGLDDVFVRLSRCCTPVPGDEIIGFVTRGRGVSVHRADCANAVSLASGQADRLIDVEWDIEPGGVFIASVEVKALDRAKLLRDVTVGVRRPPRQHPELHHADRLGPGLEDALRHASWATPRTSTRCCRPSGASTASTTPTGSYPGGAANPDSL